jgi:glyoxylase-like metal-dependent hydrolase (beta-lactamase superfamily II)
LRLDDGEALFFDLDGTLADIGPDPDAIALPAETAAALGRIAARLGGAVALISGRGLADLAARSPDSVWRAGHHGMLTAAPGETLPPAPPPPHPAVLALLESLPAAHPGVRLELKGPVVAVHFRAAPEAGIDFYRRAGWPEAAIDNYKSRFGGFGRGVSQMPDSYRRLSDDDRFMMAGQDWHVIIGSGHSPEHACLHCPALGLLISGDQILPRISSNISVHPTEPEANPLRDWLESCEKLLEAVPEDVFVLPAHNEPFTGAHIRLRQLIDGHETALGRLRRKLAAGPCGVLDTFTSIFGRSIADDEIGMATGEAIAHLNYLRSRGEVMAETDKQGILRYGMVTAH